ncbi:MAG: DinB family protein [Opitutaceae bacterium]|nr:DinB family protein [Opitutaceae bacterium]
MKKILLLLSLLATAVAGFSADTLSADDRKKGLAYLEKTRAGVVAAVKGLSEAQLNFKPAPERWSVAQTLEHIASAEDMLRDLAADKAMQGPARPAGEDVKAIDEMILKMIPDRSKKATAPEPLIPVNRYGSTKEALAHFQASRAKTIAFMKETAGLRDHAIDSPLGKKLDPYQWLLFVAAHSERHTKQMLEVKADPKFPKK